MKLKPYTKFRVIMLAVVICFLLAGCSLWDSSGELGAEIDPPPEDIAVLAESEWGDEGEPADVTDEQIAGITVYVQDPNGFVVPIGLDIPFTPDIAKETLHYMVRGGPVEDQLPPGFTPLLPEGTEVIGMNIKSDKLAVVDFSESFLDYDPSQERKVVESIVYALTEFDESIEQVQIWVNGRTLQEMPAHGTPLSGAMTRSFGINLEQSDGIILSRATPVTVYFQGATAANESYLVPVTRLIPYTEERALASLEQLISGPSASSVLDPVALPGTRIVDLTKSEDTLNLYLADASLEAGQAIPAPFLESTVLSLLENSDVSHVKIHMDGVEEVYGHDDQNYTEPITRPARINRLGL